MPNYLDIAYPICLDIPRQKKHVSMIFHKKQLLAIGTNSFKTHPQAKKIGYMYEEMHSELDAFTKISKEFKTKKLTLVNVRFNRYKELRMSKPCDLCQPWCEEIFNEIYYTTNDGMIQFK